MTQHALTSFTLTRNLLASEPPEIRGLPRSAVRLMVVDRRTGKIRHSKFENIGNFLRTGDLIVFNSSRTLPASLKGRDLKSGNNVEVRLAEHLPDDSWLALLLGSEPFEGMWVEFGFGLSCVVSSRDTRITKLWKVRFNQSRTTLMSLIYDVGRPIRYEYVPAPLSLDYYQNVYSSQPGSSEMPSAGRAFTWKVLFGLKKAGINTANIVLHAGLSSFMDDDLDSKHPISEEEFIIDSTAATKINHALSIGNRIIAVGTTVVRALESTSQEGTIVPGHGYTRLHITHDYRLKTVDGLLTGLHEPEASHLDLLRAFLPEDALSRAYEEAVKLRYLWHEFGDLNLIV
jgi:S-adenosylmethionine:tRNA ribosyltransferase-isomerase